MLLFKSKGDTKIHLAHGIIPTFKVEGEFRSNVISNAKMPNELDDIRIVIIVVIENCPICQATRTIYIHFFDRYKFIEVIIS